MIFDTYDSPLGEIRLCCDGSHLTAVVFTGQAYAQQHIPYDAIFGTHPVLQQTKTWLSLYFQGKIPETFPPVRLSGTPFQEKVWALLSEIPYGKTITYGELAGKLGCKSAQAVGRAVGRNPISILIPCHRVIGTRGQLTGYAAGTAKKEALLKLENGHLP